jgi:hypothetical protein
MSETKEHPAIVSLRTEQGQLDDDGVCVAVSRQAVEETLAILDQTRAALKAMVSQFAHVSQWSVSPNREHPADTLARANAALATASPNTPA